MPTKIGINQHDILHIHYPNDCCLCRSEQEVARLKDERIQSDKEWADKCIKLKAKIRDEREKSLESSKIRIEIEREYNKLDSQMTELSEKYTSAISLMNDGNKLIDSLKSRIATLEDALKRAEGK